MAILLFVFACFLFFYLHKGIRRNEQVFMDAQSAWQREEQRLAEIRSIDRSIGMVQEEKLEFESHFANSLDIVPFLDDLEALARQAGAFAEVTSVKERPGDIGLDVSLRANGKFDAIYKMLRLIENSHYEIKVISSDMQIDSIAGPESSDWRAVFQLRLITYLE